MLRKEDFEDVEARVAQGRGSYGSECFYVSEAERWQVA